MNTICIAYFVVVSIYFLVRILSFLIPFIVYDKNTSYSPLEIIIDFIVIVSNCNNIEMSNVLVAAYKGSIAMIIKHK